MPTRPTQAGNGKTSENNLLLLYLVRIISCTSLPLKFLSESIWKIKDQNTCSVEFNSLHLSDTSRQKDIFHVCPAIERPTAGLVIWSRAKEWSIRGIPALSQGKRPHCSLSSAERTSEANVTRSLCEETIKTIVNFFIQILHNLHLQIFVNGNCAKLSISRFEGVGQCHPLDNDRSNWLARQARMFLVRGRTTNNLLQLLQPLAFTANRANSQSSQWITTLFAWMVPTHD